MRRKNLPDSGDQKRLTLVSLMLFSLFALLIVQFYRIQIVQGEKWTKVARNQHHTIVEEPFKRGLFYSNTSLKSGHPEDPQAFVTDVLKFHLYIDPKSIPEKYRSEVSDQFEHFLKIEDDRRAQEKMRAHFGKKSRSRKVATWLDQDKKDEILSWWHPFARKRKIARNALYFVQDYKRSYPFGKLLGQVLQTVREDMDDTTNHLPTGGLEMVYDQELRGKRGKRHILRSPRHPLDMGEVLETPEDGSDIYLTINHHIQAIAEEEIEKGVKQVNAKSGWALMMDPFTGEIVALAQYPFFDPREYSRYFGDPELLDSTHVKAVSDGFEPGSIMKPVVMATILQMNERWKKEGNPSFIAPDDKIATGQGKVKGNKSPIKDLRHHKYMNMNLAVQKSGNIYFAKAVESMLAHYGPNDYRNGLIEIFGIGEKTDVELPSESAGLVPTPGKVYPNGSLQWSGPTPYSIALGHNLQTSGMQMVRAFSVFANGGKLVSPTIVRKIVKKSRDYKERVLLDNTHPSRVEQFPQVLDPKIARQMVEAMKYVTKPGGTSPRADIYGYTEAGKSGTAEKIVNGKYSKQLHFSNFIGMAPADNPRFVLMIGIDEPEKKFVPGRGKVHHGGQCAAPIFREIAYRTLTYLGVEPDDKHGYPKTDPRYDNEKADYSDEVKQLKTLYEEWNK